MYEIISPLEMLVKNYMTKIYVVSQNQFKLPTSPILIPLNADLDTGDNISNEQNFSELRAHYWVWKNEPRTTDVIGFFQFRRYLLLDQKHRSLPYIIRKFPQEKDISLDAIQGWDVIAPLPEYTGSSVLKRYAEMHRLEDLNTVLKIINERYPEYGDAAKIYFAGKSEYYCNLYIMRREIFDHYCEWLFDILKVYENSAENIPFRAHGYIAERLFGIWFTKVKGDNNLRWKEVPRIHFWGYDDEKHNLRKEKFINMLLPPGSKRRALIRTTFK